MAQEIRQYTLVIPAGTQPGAPVTLDMGMPAREVQGLEIIVPAGPNGLVGFKITNSGLPVIPYDSDEWIITSGEVISWPLSGYITSGAWEISGYNTGTLDHAVYVRFLLTLPPTPGGPVASAGAVLDTTSLDQAVDVPEGDAGVLDMASQ